jgi:hypothetical protein
MLNRLYRSSLPRITLVKLKKWTLASNSSLPSPRLLAVSVGSLPFLCSWGCRSLTPLWPPRTVVSGASKDLQLFEKPGISG